MEHGDDSEQQICQSGKGRHGYARGMASLYVLTYMLPPESFHATSLPSWKKRNLAWEVHNNNHPFPNNPSSRIGSPFTTLPWHLNRFKPPGEHYRTQSTKYNTHTHCICIYIYIHNVCPSHHQMIPRHGGPTSLWPNFSSRPFWSPGSWVRSGGCRVILPPAKWRIVPNGSHLKKLRLT